MVCHQLNGEHHLFARADHEYQLKLCLCPVPYPAVIISVELGNLERLKLDQFATSNNPSGGFTTIFLAETSISIIICLTIGIST